MNNLYTQFLREKKMLVGVSPSTLKYFEWTFNSWDKHVGGIPTKANVKDWVVQLQESGVSPFTINSRIRGLNSFLTWLFENEHISEPIRIKTVKTGQKQLDTFTDEELKKLISWKPKTFAEYRLYTLLCLAIDTGCRITELLTLTRENLDLESLVISVVGKGNKARVVPISLECRKVVFSFLKRHKFELVFPTSHGEIQKGTQLSYRYALDQLKALYKRLGIKNKKGFHKFRHSFATSYLRDGGNVMYLRRLLGHTDLSTTMIYVNVQTEDLATMHKKTSLLSRLK